MRPEAFAKVLLLLLVPRACWSITIDDYCKIKSSNTPCKGCGRASQCGQTTDSFAYLTADERDFVLAQHNILRNDVAAGKYEAKFLKAAADMQVMSWDKEVEFVAACHAKGCQFKHDDMRVGLNKVAMGQNLFVATASNYDNNKKNFLGQAVKGWFAEIRFLSASNANHLYTSFSTPNAKGATGHLTQVVWGNSNLLGCAFMHYLYGKSHKSMVVCNYAPPGNFQKRPMYKAGEPACADKNTNYTSLCGQIRSYSADKYQPPIQLNGASKQRGVLVLVPLLLLLKALV